MPGHQINAISYLYDKRVASSLDNSTPEPSPENKVTLEQWRQAFTGIEEPVEGHTNRMFPNETVRSTYLKDAQSWPDQEVRNILRLMLGESRSDTDPFVLFGLKAKVALNGVDQHSHNIDKRGWITEPDRRALMRKSGKSNVPPTWEGLTWVLDLLPHMPKRAIDVIDGYLEAYAWTLPDIWLTGLTDASDLIEARYITGNNDLDVRMTLLQMSFDIDWTESQQTL